MAVDFFVRRPIFSSVCSLIILLVGLICIPTLPIAQYPQIAPPQVTVISNYIGANAEVVESAVTTPLEQAINGVEGMKYMYSSSTNDGTSTINIVFNLERDLDAAVVDVQNRVQTATARLPAEVKATGIQIEKNSTAMVLVYGVFDKNQKYDNFFMSNYIDRYITDAIKRVNGVGQVTVFGERKFAMRLWLDPDKLARRNLTASDVVAALQEQNVQVAAGQVGQPPIQDKQAIQMSVKAGGRLKDADEFDNMIIKAGTDGSLIRLRDVGRTELGAETYASSLQYQGQDALGLAIFQLPGANSLEVAKGVKQELLRLSKGFPPGLSFVQVVDSTEVVTESINEVLWTLGGAILLVVAVIFIFLQNWRTTLIPAITIPVSLVGTFAFLKIFGFSINTLTLFGITLATGLVVDDAIVVIENIERFIQEKNMSPFQAALEGLKEVFGAVIATSLVLIAVFVPISFFPGTAGQLYKQFALTIAFSIAISAFNALTLTPALSALLLSKTHQKENFFFKRVNASIQWMRDTYAWMLKAAIRHWGIVMASFVLMLALTLLLFKTVPTGFVPNEEKGYLMAIVQAPAGTSLMGTQKILHKIEAILAKDPDIRGVFSVGGFSFAGNTPNNAMIFANLQPLEEREGKEHSASGIVARLQGQLMGIPDAIIIPMEPPALEGVGNFGGFQFELKDEGGHALTDLASVSQTIAGAANQNPVLQGVFSPFNANSPQIQVDVDRFKAKQMGVSLSDVFSTMQIFLGSAYVNDFDYLNRVYRVYVQADQQFRRMPSDIGQFYVRSINNQMVPMSNLLDIKQTYSAPLISHYNLFRSSEITGSPKPGSSSGQAISAMEEVAQKNLPQGYSFEWAGTAREEQESGAKAVFIFALSFVFVFLILAAQYESLWDPIIILLAVPLAILGALGAQFLAHQQNDIFCQIGLVMLIGLSSKNAILIVEFANQLREQQGMSIVEAAFEAAKIRFRPIIMTSLAFILGILPLIMASGAGSAGRHSMGYTVLGGMILSTTLNLLLVPVLYILINQIHHKLFKPHNN
ncbi:MAG: multidrug efflux RND transporter permease subunit [Vampirovibrionales bacterium]|nr:multidrug efflux RND transporter permease subunit [Vampirovibrionales bacterium]